MRNVAIWFVEEKCVVSNVIPPEEIGLTLLHKTLVICTYFGNIRDS